MARNERAERIVRDRDFEERAPWTELFDLNAVRAALETV